MVAMGKLDCGVNTSEDEAPRCVPGTKKLDREVCTKEPGIGSPKKELDIEDSSLVLDCEVCTSKPACEVCNGAID